MSSLIIDHRDISLDYESYCLLIRHPKQPLRSMALKTLQRIVCLHNVNVSSRLLGQCHAQGIDFIVLNSRHSEYSFALYAPHLVQASRRLKQYQLLAEHTQALPLAQRLVQHKLVQALHNLRRHPHPSATHCLQLQLQAAHQSQNSLNLEQLRGIEGAAQRALFSHWRACLDPRWGFTKRQRRPAPDPVNALLSLTYQLIYHETIRQCVVNGLDPWLGFYHQLVSGRMSLACDLMEPLRPAIEAWVLKLLNQGTFDLRHFSHSHGACLLGKTGREIFYLHWHRQLPHWSRRLKRYAALYARYLDTTKVSLSHEQVSD